MADKRIPVILDTDIGGDIDDTWALGFLLKCPELDLKLVTTVSSYPRYPAKIACKFLQTVGRADVPVGLGVASGELTDADIASFASNLNQSKWVEGYTLSEYPGELVEDGVGRLIDVVMNSNETVTIVAIGPAQNVAEALAREPRIAQKARFVGMHGSVRVGYAHTEGRKPCPECNVVSNPAALDKVFKAPWPITITPLDTCGYVVLEGELFQRVRKSDKSIPKAIMENYTAWLGENTAQMTVEGKSSTLFDTVAVYLAFAEDFCTMEDMRLRVTDDGMTVIDETQPNKLHVAASWKDKQAFYELLVSRLTN